VDNTCATVVKPCARCATTHEVIELSNDVDPSGRSASPSSSPLTIPHPRTTPQQTNITASSIAGVVNLRANQPTNRT
jgi:hypothetical protein